MIAIKREEERERWQIEHKWFFEIVIVGNDGTWMEFLDCGFRCGFGAVSHFCNCGKNKSEDKRQLVFRNQVISIALDQFQDRTMTHLLTGEN